MPLADLADTKDESPIGAQSRDPEGRPPRRHRHATSTLSCTLMDGCNVVAAVQVMR